MDVGRASHQHDAIDGAEYQANLKLTNKYAERFGLTDSDHVTGWERHQASFGADKHGYRHEQSYAEVSAYDETKQADRHYASQDHYCIQRSYAKKEEKASKGSAYREEPVGSHFCRYE